MRIVLLAQFFAPDVGGVEITAELLARGWTERGDEVIVVTRTREEDDREFPFAVVRCPSPRELLRIMGSADAVFHNNPVLRFQWAASLAGRPWVVTLRGFLVVPGERLPRRSRVLTAAKLSVISHACVLMANSRATAESVGGADAIIYNSYRSDIFFAPDVPARSRSMVCVARLDDKQKGVDLVIDAMVDVVQVYPDAKLTVVGEGAERLGLEEHAVRVGVSDNVTFAGRLLGTDLGEALRRHEVAIVPSRWPETFGTVALEAAASGCIPVVADHGGLPEAAGPTGPAVPPNDAVALARALIDLFGDEAARARYRAAAPGHLARHQESRMVEDYRDALVRAMHVRRPRRRRGRRILRLLLTGT